MPRVKKLDDTGVYRRQDSPYWYYSITLSRGNTKCFSTGKTVKEEAIKVRLNHLKENLAGNRTNEPSSITVKQLVDKYLAWLDREEKRSAANTRQRLYRKGGLIERLGSYRAAKLSTEDSVKYREERKKMRTNRGTGFTSDITVNRELSYLNAAYHYGRNDVTPRLVNDIPKLDILSDKEEGTARQVMFPRNKYEEMRNALPGYLRLLFICAYYTGMRMGELLQLEWEMIDFDDLMFNLPGRITKNGKPRHAPLSRIWGAEMLDCLTAEYAENGRRQFPSKFVFYNPRTQRRVKNFRGAWEKYTTKLGIAHINFHDLRRTAIKNLELLGVPQRERMLISGHLTDSMEKRYNFMDKSEIREARTRMEEKLLANQAKAATAAPAPGETISEADRALLNQIKSLPASMKAAVQTIIGGAL